MTNGFLLQWSGPTNYQYTIQWKTNLAPVIPWNTVLNPVINVTYTPTNGDYSWFDDGSLTGGWPPAKVLPGGRQLHCRTDYEFDAHHQYRRVRDHNAVDGDRAGQRHCGDQCAGFRQRPGGRVVQPEYPTYRQHRRR